MINRLRKSGYAIPQGGGNTAGFVVDNYSGPETLVLDYGVNDRQTLSQSGSGTVLVKRTRFTAAEINAGATLLAAKPGYKYRLVDAVITAVGGTTAGLTAAVVNGTQSAAGVALVTAPLASIARSVPFSPSAAAHVLADGASFAACDANTAVTVGKTGGDLTGATHVDFVVSYVIDKA
jgi:hypothetical protein